MACVRNEEEIFIIYNITQIEKKHGAFFFSYLADDKSNHQVSAEDMVFC